MHQAVKFCIEIIKIDFSSGRGGGAGKTKTSHTSLLFCVHMQRGNEAEYVGSRAQPLPDQASQPGLHPPHQPQQLQGINEQPQGINQQPQGINQQPQGIHEQPQGINQQPYMQLNLVQGQSKQPLAQPQQSIHQVQQLVGLTHQSQLQPQVQQLSNHSEVPVSLYGLSPDQHQSSALGSQLPEQPCSTCGEQGYAAFLPARLPLQGPGPHGGSAVGGMGTMQAAAQFPAYASHVMQDQQICFEAPGFGVAPAGPDDIASNQSLGDAHWLAGEANSDAGWHGAAADHAAMPMPTALVDNMHALPQPSSAARQSADSQQHNCFVPSPQGQALYQSDPSAAASMSAGLSTAPQLANNLGDKMSSLERLRRDAEAAVAQQQPNQLTDPGPVVLSDSLMTGAKQPSQLVYDMAPLSQAGSQPSSQLTVQPPSCVHMLTSEGLSGSESPSALAEQPDLSGLILPDFDCYDDGLIRRELAWEHQTASINSGGQDEELVEARDVRPPARRRRDSAARKRDRLRNMKLQVQKYSWKFAETMHSRHKRTVDRSYKTLQALKVQQQVP